MSRVIYTAGVFDLLHRGHLNVLRKSRAMGDILIVGVVSDDGAEAYKRRPIQDEATRLAVINALHMVDLAVIQPTTDPSSTIEWLIPRWGVPIAMTHGSDWDQLREGNATLDRHGIRFVRIPYTQGVSTGAIIERILERGAEAVR